MAEPASESGHFELVDNRLTANADLYWENHAEFMQLCEALIDSPSEELILDLSNVTFIFSAYMGSIGKLLADAAKKNKHLRLRIHGNLSWLFEMVGFEKLIDIEVAN